MHSPEHCFTLFHSDITGYSLPERFTFPFYYDPHPLCLLAAEQLQSHLATQTQWYHNFGLGDDKVAVIGKMFGVLVVQNRHNEIGYLAAFSGKLADANLIPHFVPPVFDMLAEDGFFLPLQLEINAISEQISTLSSDPKLTELNALLASQTTLFDQQSAAQREKMIYGREQRKAQRTAAQTELSPAEITQLNAQLSHESIQEKNQLRDLKQYWQQQLTATQQQLDQFTSQIGRLTQQRKDLSAALQQKLFEQYRFLNAKGIAKNLNDLFNDTPDHAAPAGSGECAAPKLLQFAFKSGMKPIAMAEFWWGAPPKSAIRQHQNFYPACLGKCQPILTHMLDGLAVDENPLLVNPALGKTLDIVYQDEAILVINKPAEFLSVPGKNIQDSVYLRIKQAFPQATGPLIVHRLDMSTSGLMVIALNKNAHQHLQQQFIRRSVEKRYVALLSGLLQPGLLPPGEGEINLPLRQDIDDRPRQRVCHQHGKNAQTRWQVIGQSGNQTKVYLYPKTGRTHQLRVHCAHPSGLNLPICGDDLYGTKADRLYLHAQLLAFHHPVTKALMRFEVEPGF